MSERDAWSVYEVTLWLLNTDYPPARAASDGLLCAEYVNNAYAAWRDGYAGTLPDWWDNRRDGAAWRQAMYEVVQGFFYRAESAEESEK